MSTAAALLAVWIALPRPAGEWEDEQERASRLATIAAAVQAEARTPLEAAIVAATIEHESQNFRLDVHDGRRRGDSGRALCLGQVWESAWLPRADHRRTVGTDYASTARCVHAVVVSYDRIKCSTLIGKFSVYAAGRGCGFVWSGADERFARTLFYYQAIRNEPATSKGSQA